MKPFLPGQLQRGKKGGGKRTTILHCEYGASSPTEVLLPSCGKRWRLRRGRSIYHPPPTPAHRDLLLLSSGAQPSARMVDSGPRLGCPAEWPTGWAQGRLPSGCPSTIRPSDSRRETWALPSSPSRPRPSGSAASPRPPLFRARTSEPGLPDRAGASRESRAWYLSKFPLLPLSQTPPPPLRPTPRSPG